MIWSLKTDTSKATNCTAIQCQQIGRKNNGTSAKLKALAHAMLVSTRQICSTLANMHWHCVRSHQLQDICLSCCTTQYRHCLPKTKLDWVSRMSILSDKTPQISMNQGCSITMSVTEKINTIQPNWGELIMKMCRRAMKLTQTLISFFVYLCEQSKRVLRKCDNTQSVGLSESCEVDPLLREWRLLSSQYANRRTSEN